MKVVRIRSELQMGPKNLVLWKILRLGLMFIWGQKKNLQFESGLDKFISVRISQNSSPKFLCKKDSKLKEVWKMLYTPFSVLKPDNAY